MLYMVIGRDGSDGEALGRRMAARPAHLEGFTALHEAGHAQWAGAMLDPDTGAMTGSVCLMNFPDRAALDAWLAREPYVLGGVWQDVEIQHLRAAPMFAS